MILMTLSLRTWVWNIDIIYGNEKVVQRWTLIPLNLYWGTYFDIPNNLTSFRNRDQEEFKCMFLIQPFEMPFKDKTMTKFWAPKQTIPRMWWLTLGMLSQWTWIRNIGVICGNENKFPNINLSFVMELKPSFF